MKIRLSGWTPWYQFDANGRRRYIHSNDDVVTSWGARFSRRIEELIEDVASGRYRCRSYARCPGSIARRLSRVRREAS